MVLVLVIGDAHIPHRAASIPPKFKDLLVPGKLQHVICTGNMCTKETLDYLSSIASDVHVVRGDFDDAGLASPEETVVNLGSLKFGVIHGHQVVPWGDRESLSITQRRMGVDVLVSGHTHKLETWGLDGKYFINPGSCTGSYTGLTSDVEPSFLILDLQGKNIITFKYRLRADGSVKVDREDWIGNQIKAKQAKKPAAAAAAAAAAVADSSQ
eukprot:CAMPEP_0177659960 /NCGR_PEP_ID=MMETSP0447-20121125/17740_1 /TAXON_ID=0 /ORGANISM="Stygamoeba regulata, Strain BSH-02190019" /LENGTH=211 /DNA_ID=CAMNT_0019164903 /DNA_START=68 /DNA_END=703 /DNA_ORIENTATION=+